MTHVFRTTTHSWCVLLVQGPVEDLQGRQDAGDFTASPERRQWQRLQTTNTTRNKLLAFFSSRTSPVQILADCHGQLFEPRKVQVTVLNLLNVRAESRSEVVLDGHLVFLWDPAEERQVSGDLVASQHNLLFSLLNFCFPATIRRTETVENVLKINNQTSVRVDGLVATPPVDHVTWLTG